MEQQPPKRHCIQQSLYRGIPISGMLTQSPMDRGFLLATHRRRSFQQFQIAGGVGAFAKGHQSAVAFAICRRTQLFAAVFAFGV